MEDGEKNGYSAIFENRVLEKILKLATKQSSIIQIECGKLLCLIFGEPRILAKLLTVEKEHLLADLINSLLLMLERFDQLPLNRQIGRVCRTIVTAIVESGKEMCFSAFSSRFL